MMNGESHHGNALPEDEGVDAVLSLRESQQLKACPYAKIGD